MRELVIVSGKGGTGKTSVTAALAALTKTLVISDCDVDAPNLHLLLSPQIQHTEEFIASQVASIDSQLCTQCNACKEACRFDAITPQYEVDPILCEGCKVCSIVCPAGAVQLTDRLSGYIYTSKTQFGPMTHALLLPGESNSGKLVTLVRERAHKLAQAQKKDLILIDGPPGIACSTIAAISGVTAGLIVTEPTIPAIHDLERTLQLFTHFEIPVMVLINKYDLNISKTQQIMDYCTHHAFEIVGRIPYDPIITQAMVAGHSIISYAPRHPISRSLKEIQERIEQQLIPLSSTKT